jgi:hypothetical protein
MLRLAKRFLHHGCRVLRVDLRGVGAGAGRDGAGGFRWAERRVFEWVLQQFDVRYWKGAS